jgi:AraC-like DNA-binding protein
MSTHIPSAGLIRQELRSILQEQILPGMRGSTPPHMFSAQLPLVVPADIHVSELPIPILKESAAISPFPWELRWDHAGVHAIQFPVLCCVVAGEIDLRIGVTAKMLKSTARPKRQCGAYVVALPSPSYFVIPSGVPYTTGSFLPWERSGPQQSPAHIFWVRVLPTGALCHTTLVYDGQQQAQYSLLMEDDLLAPMMEILLAALNPTKTNPEIAHAQLLVLFLRLQENLQYSMPMITDGLHSRFAARKPAKPRVSAARAALPESQSPILEKACDYIQFHLHEPLTPDDVARHLRLKPEHLNRLFRKHLDTSIMRYVMRQRMETAKLLLQSSELSMQEISRLVGYKYLSHFSRSFFEYVGMPPLKFRQNQAPLEHSHRRKS